VERIIIQGGNRLTGRVNISGAKNASLPLLVASLLCDGVIEMDNIPHSLADIATMNELLESLGVRIDGNKYDGRNITSTHADYEIVRKMRASIIVLGALLARFGEAEVSLPGGCAIGARPVDLHLFALEAMGADIAVENGYVKASGRLHGAVVEFAKISVGATQNAVMAASLADGQSVLKNVAAEPEIVDLCNMLVAMGADISGIGTHELVVNGVERLHSCKYSVMADRIEAGTYAIAAVMTGGEIEIAGASPEIYRQTLDRLVESGAKCEQLDDTTMRVTAGETINPVSIITQEHPGFPTDMQAQWTSLMAIANGKSYVKETIFENRFMHIPELARMGADIAIDGDTANITGVERLSGAQVMATDLRASVCLVLAALVADGETSISRVYHIDRGYESVEAKFTALGADIKRVAD